MLDEIMFFIVFIGAVFGLFSPSQDTSGTDANLVDDFETYSDGELPLRWKILENQKLVWVKPRHMSPNERFYVVQEGRNKFLRVFTQGEAAHLNMANEPDGFDWNLSTHPYLEWDWRAQQLPIGAREDKSSMNDAGLALYVFFSFTGFIIKRPVAIKYTYSSTLPVGTILKQDKLRVIVVASGEEELKKWMHIKRNVADDYRRVFNENPPDRPLSIRLWSDSDDTNLTGEGDFDNIKFLQK